MFLSTVSYNRHISLRFLCNVNFSATRSSIFSVASAAETASAAEMTIRANQGEVQWTELKRRFDANNFDRSFLGMESLELFDESFQKGGLSVIPACFWLQQSCSFGLFVIPILHFVSSPFRLIVRNCATYNRQSVQRHQSVRV